MIAYESAEATPDARLVGQVVRVSLETVAIVEGLPAAFEPASGA